MMDAWMGGCCGANTPEGISIYVKLAINLGFLSGTACI